MLKLVDDDIERYLPMTITRCEKPQASLVYLLVMTGRHFKLAEEYVSIAKVTVGPPLSRLIPKLFSDEQTLPNGTNSRVHVTATEVRINRIHFEVIKRNRAFTTMGSDKTNLLLSANVVTYVSIKGFKTKGNKSSLKQVMCSRQLPFHVQLLQLQSHPADSTCCQGYRGYDPGLPDHPTPSPGPGSLFVKKKRKDNKETHSHVKVHTV